jgi:hypothetical protein
MPGMPPMAELEQSFVAFALFVAFGLFVHSAIHGLAEFMAFPIHGIHEHSWHS